MDELWKMFKSTNPPIEGETDIEYLGRFEDFKIKHKNWKPLGLGNSPSFTNQQQFELAAKIAASLLHEGD